MWEYAVYLVYGAISYIGGKLLQSALGGAVLSDTKTWMQEAVAELKAFVSAELRRQFDERDIQQMSDDLRGVIENLHEYAQIERKKLPTNRFLIENADIITARLVRHLLDYPQAMTLAFSAMAYRFYVLNALFESDHAAGHITSAKELVDEFLTKSSKNREFIVSKLDPGHRIRLDCDMVEPDGPWYCWAELDGQQVGDSFRDDHQPPVSARGGAQNLINNKILPAVRKQIEDFKTGSHQLMQLTIECYDKMCKKIGRNYTPPVGLFSSGEPNTLLSVGDRLRLPGPSVFFLPGAIVIRSDEPSGPL